ncbi:MAG: hypothetical protein DDT31_00231 [Syntrophomonadaceae bacterium]|nr:hypothetical protein [Bacillota bacterium]
MFPLKGGIDSSSEDQLENATRTFFQMLDDRGSAAGTWMSYVKKAELYALHRAKHHIKSTGVDIEELDPAAASAKVKKKIIALTTRGWKLFAKEETGDYVDMIFTKAP